MCVGIGEKAVCGAPARADHKFRRLGKNRDSAIFNRLKIILYVKVWDYKANVKL